MTFRKIVVHSSLVSSSARCVIPLECLTLKLNALPSFEKSLTVYQSTRCNIWEDLNLQSHRSENLKSGKIKKFVPSSRIRKIAKKKATISFVMSVRLSVHKEQLDSQWAVFREIWYLSIFRKSVKKIQVSLKYERQEQLVLSMKTYVYLWLYLP